MLPGDKGSKAGSAAFPIGGSQGGRELAHFGSDYPPSIDPLAMPGFQQKFEALHGGVGSAVAGSSLAVPMDDIGAVMGGVAVGLQLDGDPGDLGGAVGFGEGYGVPRGGAPFLNGDLGIADDDDDFAVPQGEYGLDHNELAPRPLASSALGTKKRKASGRGWGASGSGRGGGRGEGGGRGGIGRVNLGRAMGSGAASRGGQRAPRAVKTHKIGTLIKSGLLEEGSMLRYKNRSGELLMSGLARPGGIECMCGCAAVVSCTGFEEHAGSKLHRPCEHIYLSDGRTLQDLMHAMERVPGAPPPQAEVVDYSDDLCRACGDVGELLCCEACPATFHIRCLGMDDVPQGDWWCPACRCALCGTSDFASAPSTEEEQLADHAVLLCDQCEREFHVGCLREQRGMHLSSIPDGDWFCGEACRRTHTRLAQLNKAGWTPLGGGGGGSGGGGSPLHWVAVRQTPELPHAAKIRAALEVMTECFHPIQDMQTGQDLVPLIVQSQRLPHCDFSNFYLFMLKAGSQVATVATVRLFGNDVAEMPLVATRFVFRGMGLARRLVRVVEDVLYGMGVRTLILPAVPGIEQTWRHSFGFRDCTVPERVRLSQWGTLVFPGTTTLQKSLSPDTLTKVAPLGDRQFVPLRPPPAEKRRPGRPPGRGRGRVGRPPGPGRGRVGRPPKNRQLVEDPPPPEFFPQAGGAGGGMAAAAGGGGVGSPPGASPSKHLAEAMRAKQEAQEKLMVVGTTRSQRQVRTTAKYLDGMDSLLGKKQPGGGGIGSPTTGVPGAWGGLAMEEQIVMGGGDGAFGVRDVGSDDGGPLEDLGG